LVPVAETARLPRRFAPRNDNTLSRRHCEPRFAGRGNLVVRLRLPATGTTWAVKGQDESERHGGRSLRPEGFPCRGGNGLRAVPSFFKACGTTFMRPGVGSGFTGAGRGGLGAAAMVCKASSADPSTVRRGSRTASGSGPASMFERLPSSLMRPVAAGSRLRSLTSMSCASCTKVRSKTTDARRIIRNPQSAVRNPQSVAPHTRPQGTRATFSPPSSPR